MAFGAWEESVFAVSGSHDEVVATPSLSKNIFFSRGEEPMTSWLGLKQTEQWPNTVCSNDGPKLTFTTSSMGFVFFQITP